jgi:hypothetical protein
MSEEEATGGPAKPLKAKIVKEPKEGKPKKEPKEKAKKVEAPKYTGPKADEKLMNDFKTGLAKVFKESGDCGKFLKSAKLTEVELGSPELSAAVAEVVVYNCRGLAEEACAKKIKARSLCSCGSSRRTPGRSPSSTSSSSSRSRRMACRCRA